MNDLNNPARPKMSLQIGNLIMISVILLLCLLLAVNTIQLSSYNKKCLELSEYHMTYTDIAMQLNLGSDILTEQDRSFAATGNVE